MPINYDREIISQVYDLIREKTPIKKSKTRYMLTLLKKMFNNYFNGEYYLKGLEFLELNEDKLAEYIKLKFDYHLEIYNISNKNWRIINETLSRIVVVNDYVFSSPGDILAFFLTEEFNLQNHGQELTKYKSKCLYLAFRELEKSKRIQEVTPECKKLVNRLKKKTVQTDRFTILDLIKTLLAPHELTKFENKEFLLNDYLIRRLRHMY